MPTERAKERERERERLTDTVEHTRDHECLGVFGSTLCVLL